VRRGAPTASKQLAVLSFPWSVQPAVAKPVLACSAECGRATFFVLCVLFGHGGPIRFERTWGARLQDVSRYAEAGGVRKKEEAVQGRGRCAWTRRRSRIPTTVRPLPTLSGGGWVPKRNRSRLGSLHGPNPFCRRPIGGFLRKGSVEGFTFWLPASSASAGARSLLVPGTCDLTPRRSDASDLAAPGARKDPPIPAP
jgi:hypothetical protein